ncbi:GNAT family N-acetyltransferase [Dysgonomonas sp. 216]|uniref:GNAT family N-acetyltransferase n=1 Tax=Dysgonomonas sp. 216 TaxID=2302934 RepID=UPI0013D3D56A|nr:GNAT family N-acetyltransferase [Dysgonomonas sp. 216]NDW19382.1 GNAT family N-acetyltransferase [Dysgonomonas sp. 216]
MEIIEAQGNQFFEIGKIARESWYNVYANLLSVDQIEYMLEWMYSVDSIKDQTQNQGHKYLLLKDESLFIGFISYEVNYKNESKTKIHKIYILPNMQKKGAGRILIDRVERIAKDNNNRTLVLNMNKQNNAVHFYRKMGFDIVKEEVNDIGNGYVMDDYVLEKNLDI